MRHTNIRKRLMASSFMGAAAAFAAAAVPAIVMTAPSVAVAQDFTTGAITGTVLSTANEPVAGATVTLSQNGRAQTRTLTTDAEGRFRAQQIPVGSYTISISQEGYQPYTDANVSVALGASTSLEFVIGSAGASSDGTSVDDIVVVGTRAAGVDFDQTSTGLTVDVQQTFDRIPTSRDLASIQLLAPQAVAGDSAFGSRNGTAGSQVSIAGSSVGENVYYINGFNVTNFRNFVGGNTVPFEFYQQIDVKTGGYQAEFGRSTGGAVIAVSRSGSDEFHGGANYYTELNSLRATSPDTVYNIDSATESDRSESNVWLSGPIWKDHAYFFGFYNTRDFDYKTLDTSGIQNTSLQDDPFYGGKIDLYLNPDHRLELTYFSDDQTQTIVTDDGVSVSNTWNYAGGDTKIAKYTGQFTDWFTLSALYGEGTSNQTLMGDLDSEVAVVDLNINQVRGNPALVVSEGDDARKMYRLDADIYVNGLMGDHHFRVGFDREDLSSRAVDDYSGGNYIRYYRAGAGGAYGGQVAPGALYVRDRVRTVSGEFKTEQTAFYIQDAWDVNDRVSLQLGLRWEKFNNMNAAGETFVETDYDLSPRLGVTYDLFGDRSTSLKAFYGRYYIPIAANTNIRMAGNEYFVEDFYNISAIGGTYATTEQGLNDCIAASPRNSCLPTLSGGPVASNILSPGTISQATSLVSDNLEAQYQDEFIFGVEHQVSSNNFLDGWKFGANLTFRDLKSVMEDFDTGYILEAYCDSIGLGTGDGQPCDLTGSSTVGINGAGYVLLNPGKDLVITPDADAFPYFAGQQIVIPADILDLPEAKRTYKALELTFSRPWDGRWSLQGSAVFAESKGNVEGGVKSDNGQADTGLTQDFDEPGWTDGSYGFLPNHRGQTYKAYGSYALTDSIVLGANFTLQSARKYGCIGSYPNGDGRANPSTMTAWYCNGVLTPRGSQFDGGWYKNLDLSVAWDLPIDVIPGGLQVRADIFNVMGFESATDHVETGDLDAGTTNPDYKRISQYQAPRTVRLGVRYQF